MLISPRPGLIVDRYRRSTYLPTRTATTHACSTVDRASAARRSVHELKEALDHIVGLPWVNTVAADKRRERACMQTRAWCRALRPEKFMSDCLVAAGVAGVRRLAQRMRLGPGRGRAAGHHSRQAAGPWMMRADYVGNSNDSYWLTNARSLTEWSGAVRVFASIRSNRSRAEAAHTHRLQAVRRNDFAQGEGGDRRRAATGVCQPGSRGRAGAAAAAACLLRLAATARLMNPCEALGAWDMRADLDSRGAVLFREFWNAGVGHTGQMGAFHSIRSTRSTRRAD